MITKNLSKREKEILDSLLDGKTNNELAESNGIALKTVKGLLTSIYKKTGLNRYQLYIKLSPTKECINCGKRIKTE